MAILGNFFLLGSSCTGQSRARVSDNGVAAAGAAGGAREAEGTERGGGDSDVQVLHFGVQDSDVQQVAVPGDAPAKAVGDVGARVGRAGAVRRALAPALVEGQAPVHRDVDQVGQLQLDHQEEPIAPGAAAAVGGRLARAAAGGVPLVPLFGAPRRVALQAPAGGEGAHVAQAEGAAVGELVALVDRRVGEGLPDVGPRLEQQPLHDPVGIHVQDGEGGVGVHLEVVVRLVSVGLDDEEDDRVGLHVGDADEAEPVEVPRAVPHRRAFQQEEAGQDGGVHPEGVVPRRRVVGAPPRGQEPAGRDLHAREHHVVGFLDALPQEPLGEASPPVPEHEVAGIEELRHRVDAGTGRAARWPEGLPVLPAEEEQPPPLVDQQDASGIVQGPVLVGHPDHRHRLGALEPDAQIPLLGAPGAEEAHLEGPAGGEDGLAVPQRPAPADGRRRCGGCQQEGDEEGNHSVHHLLSRPFHVASESMLYSRAGFRALRALKNDDWAAAVRAASIPENDAEARTRLAAFRSSGSTPAPRW